MICPDDGAFLIPYLLSFDEHNCHHGADNPGSTAEAWEGLSEVSGMTSLGEEIGILARMPSMKHRHDCKVGNSVPLASSKYLEVSCGVN